MAKWTQVVQGENIFYHLIADRNFKCSVNFYKSLQGGVDVQVTFGAAGWVTPRSEKSQKLGEENIVLGYEPKEVTELDRLFILNEHKDINEALGWSCGRYSVSSKWIEGFYGAQNVFYQLLGDEHLKCSVNFLITTKEIRPRPTLACEDWITPRSHFNSN